MIPTTWASATRRKQVPIPQKESQKWLTSLEAASHAREACAHTRVSALATGKPMSLTCWLWSGLLGSTSWCAARGTAVSRGRSAMCGPRWRRNRSWSTSSCRCPAVARSLAVQATLALRFCPVTLCPPRHRKAEGLPVRDPVGRAGP